MFIIKIFIEYFSYQDSSNIEDYLSFIYNIRYIIHLGK